MPIMIDILCGFSMLLFSQMYAKWYRPSGCLVVGYSWSWYRRPSLSSSHALLLTNQRNVDLETSSCDAPFSNVYGAEREFVTFDFKICKNRPTSKSPSDC